MNNGGRKIKREERRTPKTLLEHSLLKNSLFFSSNPTKYPSLEEEGINKPRVLCQQKQHPTPVTSR